MRIITKVGAIIAICAIVFFSVFVFAQDQSDPIKTFVDLVMDKYEIIRGEIIGVTATLKTENESPVPDQPVDFYADEMVIGSSSTDTNGLAALAWDTSNYSPGVYVIGARFDGNSEFDKSFDATGVTVMSNGEETMQSASDQPSTPYEAMSGETLTIISPKAKKIESCVDIPYQEDQPVYDTCIDSQTTRVCDDEPVNTSCTDKIIEYNYSCVKEVIKVDKIRTECKTKGFVLNDYLKLNLERYTCSVEENGNEVTAICDSTLDGDGDALCESGETCMKFVVEGKTFKKYEKNSRDDFVENDESFWAQRISTEVLQ